MTTLAAGSNAAVTLPAGSTLTMSGLGTYQTVPPGTTPEPGPTRVTLVGNK